MRVGIIGFGGAGAAHVFYFGCVPGCAVTAIFDPSPAARGRAAHCPPGIHFTDNLDDFWPRVDAVSICSPDATHADYIERAFDRGLHVICEKPLTDSIDGLRRIIAAERRAGRKLAVLHQMRFVPLHQRIKQLLTAGALGTISYGEAYYVHDLRERAFINDNWRRTDNATPLVYSGCHMVDLLRWLFGPDDEVVEAYAASNHRAFAEYPEADLTLATLRFRSGALGKVLVAFGSAAPQDHSIRIHGTEGAIENNVHFGRSGRWHAVIHEPLLVQPLLRRRAGAPHGESLYRQLRRTAPAWVLARSFRALRYLARRPNAEYAARFHPLRLYEHSYACVAAIDDFVKSVSRGGAPACGSTEAAQTVLACLAGVESSRTNRPVAVPALADVLAS